MAIGSAVEKFGMIVLYDEKGKQIRSIPKGDGLMSCTSSTVTVKFGSTLRIYNEQGNVVRSMSSR